jgi:hypothetical protein
MQLAYDHDIAAKPGDYDLDDLAHGRGLLARVRAWPWALFSDGELPAKWWTNPDVVQAWRRWVASGDDRSGQVLPADSSGEA